MRYYREFQIGERIITSGRTVTETDIVMFAAVSGDWYPLHVDAEYAKKTQFGARVAHGLLVVSMAFGLLPFSDMAILAVTQIEKIRYLAPSMIGDTIHVEMEVMEKTRKDDAKGFVTGMVTIINQRNEKVTTAILKMLMSDGDPIQSKA
jgi:3-hydroxybutyryl-CoA dehydratase